MNEFADVNKLLEYMNSTSYNKKECCFIDGRPTNSNYEQAFRLSKGIEAAERYIVLKKLSLTVKSQTNVLLDAISYSNRCSEFTRNDLALLAYSFEYFAKYSTCIPVVSRNQDHDCCDDRIACFVLHRCPVYLILSWLTCGPLAAGKCVTLVVGEEHSAPFISFAYLAHQAGMPDGCLNVVPFNADKMARVKRLSNICGIGSKDFSLPTFIEDQDMIKFSNFYVPSSPSPMFILQTADIDSAVHFFLRSSEDHDAFWHPDIIYVEEVVYEKFSAILKQAIRINNVGNENERACQIVLSDPTLNQIKIQGYEITTLFNRATICSVVFNHDRFSISNNFFRADNYSHQIVSIRPVRTAAEGVSLINVVGCLGASLWCNDAVKFTSLAFKLKSGTVWLNSGSVYDPSVPLPLYESGGIGSFSGKESMLQHLEWKTEAAKIPSSGLYPSSRNSKLPKRRVAESTRLSLSAYKSWSNIHLNDRQSFLENVAVNMSENWETHFKIVFNQTEFKTWTSCINYIKFWCNSVTTDSLNDLYSPKDFHVLRKHVSRGFIGILADTIPLDVLIYLICGALVYGNSVVIGISSTFESCAIATELESLFQPETVTFIMDTPSSLRDQFVRSSNIVSIWRFNIRVQENYSRSKIVDSFKKDVVFDYKQDMTSSAKFLRTYAVRSQCVWLPFL